MLTFAPEFASLRLVVKDGVEWLTNG
jgi:hypothetical protein